MKKIANVLSTLLIVLLIIAIAAILTAKLIFGIEMKAVLTPSMEPELPVGSLLVISPAEYEDIKIGDDITFVRDKNLTLVTHRVIQKDDSTKKITTQGIANNSPDSPTSYDNVVGKVKFHIPLVGYFVIWTADLKGKIICAIVIVALVALSILFSSSDTEKESAEKNAEKANNRSEN